ncbi:macrophage mannose receptor 1-like [Osmerus eperlanus]|uniref:macrophage mannose receptor 1-like n=1 Tax=Osmerus eperlanus TaxID=29151 RepID=UPI002E1489C7
MEKSVLLMLLSLSGLSILPSCLSFHYEYVKESKNWTEAQRICREKYTDLATFYDDASIRDKTDRAWIGLHSGLWTWSLNGEVLPCQETSCDSNYPPWSAGKPDRYSHENKTCVRLNTKNGTWTNASCSEKKSFVCYDGRKDTNQYICICDKKTWNESQSYCRANHTDLASVRNAIEYNEIRNLSSNCDEVWIGLSTSNNWQWSDQSVSSFEKWGDGEPNGMGVPNKGEIFPMGVVRNSRGLWNDEACINNHQFICYDDDLVLVHENKTWVEALNHCRQQRWDLVSIHSERIQHWVQRRARNASTPYVWLGLRYTCALKVWFWVSEHALCHQNWAPGHGGSWEECKKAGAMPREGPQQWEGKNQAEKLNFICTRKPDEY